MCKALFDCIQHSTENGFVLLATGLSDEQAVADLHNNPDQPLIADEEHEAFDDLFGTFCASCLKRGGPAINIDISAR